MKMNKGQKLVRMLGWLRRSSGVLATDLMRDLDLDERGLRRYLADLRELDMHILSEGRGEARRLRIPVDGASGLKLNLTEVISLHFGRTLFTFLQGSTFAEDLDDALRRLQPAFPKDFQQLGASWSKRFVAVAEHGKHYGGEASEFIDELLTAILRNSPVTLHYRKLDGHTRLYDLHPYTLAIYRQGLYLFAYDEDARQVKTFALDRIREVRRVRGRTFELPADWDPDAYIEHAFGIISGRPQRIVLDCSPAIAPYIRERAWHRSQQIEAQSDGWIRLRMDVAPSPELVSWVLSFGAEMRVVAPTALRDGVRRRLQAAVEAYQAQGDRAAGELEGASAE